MSNSMRSRGLKRTALAVLLGGVLSHGAVYAQSTTGSIFGSVSAGSGTSVLIQNDSGFTRTVPVDANGRYNLGNLPVGTYSVTLQRDGQVIEARRGITLRVGSGTDVSFGDAQTLGTITVNADNVPKIDTTTVDTRTVITAEQLERLPIARTAEAVALLSPGANSGAGGYFGDLVSFGGAGVSENAYYVNGFYSADPLSNLGGFSLPFNAIAQQETYTGGYGAAYGRSAGGVINSIGKSGTNEVEFGGQIVIRPKSLRADAKNYYYPDLDLPEGYSYANAELPGTLYRRAEQDERWSNTFNAYVGGPLIKDRLFGYAVFEAEDSRANSVPAVGGAVSTESKTKNPKLYTKLNWNITDNHLLELTYLKEEDEQTGSIYEYDFETGEIGDRVGPSTAFINNSDFRIAKYTGYLTDSLTLSATYGRGRFKNQELPNIIPGVPLLSSTVNQNPAITGGTPITNAMTAYTGVDGRNDTRGLRADLQWVIGDHTVTGGIDNLYFNAHNQGDSQLADRWIYGRTTSNISGSLGIGSPVTPTNPRGYYVNRYSYSTATDMSLEQKAWYIEDRWQVTDNLMLSLGVRNDKFVNANNVGAVYLDADDQWAPRLGAAWDVFGDSSLKVYGNAGRYYLAMPNNVAIRGASASTFTSQYYTYTGIDANGAPTGLTPVAGTDGDPNPGPVSSNGEYGTPVDVLAFAPSDLKSMYQDEFILGFEKTLGSKWVMGAKATYRDLKAAMDDICDPYTLMSANGLTDINFVNGKYIAEGLGDGPVEVAYCYMFNPGRTNTFSLANVDANGNPRGGRTEVRMSAADWGFTEGVKREYKAIDLFLEHPFDGKWEGRIDYTYSKLEGNTEGQVKSEFGQDNISKTQDWDAAQIMAFANGYLANDRRHQLKVRGSYQITEEWMVGGRLTVLSGMPISCLGYYNPDGTVDEAGPEGDPIGYGSSYHTCFGQIATPGRERTPWTHQVDLSLSYRPNFADGRLTMGVQVFNVTNRQETTQVNVTSESDPYTVNNSYLRPLSRQTPRYVMFTANLDF